MWGALTTPWHLVAAPRNSDFCGLGDGLDFRIEIKPPQVILSASKFENHWCPRTINPVGPCTARRIPALITAALPTCPSRSLHLCVSLILLACALIGTLRPWFWGRFLCVSTTRRCVPLILGIFSWVILQSEWVCWFVFWKQTAMTILREFIARWSPASPLAAPKCRFPFLLSGPYLCTQLLVLLWSLPVQCGVETFGCPPSVAWAEPILLIALKAKVRSKPLGSHQPTAQSGGQPELCLWGTGAGTWSQFSPWTLMFPDTVAVGGGGCFFKRAVTGPSSRPTDSVSEGWWLGIWVLVSSAHDLREPSHWCWFLSSSRNCFTPKHQGQWFRNQGSSWKSPGIYKEIMPKPLP